MWHGRDACASSHGQVQTWFGQPIFVHVAEAGGAGKPLRRAGMEEQIAGLRVLLKHFDDAAIKDALLHRMPIYKLPAVGNLDDEIEALRTSVKVKTAQLCELDPSISGGTSVHKSFVGLTGVPASELESLLR